MSTSSIAQGEHQTALQGHCSLCRKVWTLPENQGICPWCGKPATCRTTSISRPLKTGRRKHIDPVPDNYEGLDGEWLDFLLTAQRYESKALTDDRADLRHDIILELYKARQRKGEPLDQLQQYRIASLMVALYWRKLNPVKRKVCLYYGEARKPNCGSCEHKHKVGRCLFLAMRGIPLESLDREVTNNEGETVSLADTLASDHIEDIPEKWYELSTWLLSYPEKLVNIAEKLRDDQTLTNRERQYLWYWRKREQKSLFDT